MTTPIREAFRAVVRDDPADLATPCLLIAAELSPDAATQNDSAGSEVIAGGHAELDALAANVPADGKPRDRLHAALEGFSGAPRDLRALEGSLLPDVLRRRSGLPILLSVVWLEVARRSGIDACGLGVPGRFLIAVGTSHEQSVSADVVAGTSELVDPFAGGAALTLEDVVRIARQHGALGSALDPVRLLEPAAPVDVLHRILRNIRAWADRPERLAVALAACELALLLPRRPTALTHEHAELLRRTGHFREAATAYAAYADAIESADAEAAERARIAGRLALARLN
jgi:regulator of sirC expression with transglutaminase-like and TPR domain